MANNEKRKDYISWDEYFMSIAKLSAMRSKDPSTQVGACIVSNDNRILSIGYNGAPNGFDDEKFPWGREGENLETKYPYVCHAELNAILNYIYDHDKYREAEQQGFKEITFSDKKYQKQAEKREQRKKHNRVDYLFALLESQNEGYKQLSYC